MEEKLVEELQRELQENQNIEEIRSKLISKGFLENDVDEAITSASKEILSQKKTPTKGTTKYFTKTFLDRIGFGFGSPQYINILFRQAGASLFLVGLINGIKAIISVLISSCVKEYRKQKEVKRPFTGISEILLGLSFVILIIAYFFHSIKVFIIGILLIGIFFAYYNDLFNKLFKQKLEEGRKDYLIGKITHYGLLLTVICLFAGAYILDKFPTAGYTLKFVLFEKNYSFTFYGYMIAFGIAALSFIISGLLLLDGKVKKQEEKKVRISQTIKSCFKNYRNYLSIFFRNKIILVLIIASTITAFVQTLGNSYYGIFIFNNFSKIGFGGFLNVAIIFTIALLTSIIAPLITRKNAIEYGKFPMLVFGTLLLAIMPLSYYYKPNLISISMGTILGIIGGAITGVAQGLLTLELINDYERKMYFESVSVFATIPLLITVPIGSYIAHTIGLKTLFLILALLLAFVVVPLYFFIIILYHKKEKI